MTSCDEVPDRSGRALVPDPCTRTSMPAAAAATGIRGRQLGSYGSSFMETRHTAGARPTRDHPATSVLLYTIVRTQRIFLGPTAPERRCQARHYAPAEIHRRQF